MLAQTAIRIIGATDDPDSEVIGHAACHVDPAGDFVWRGWSLDGFAVRNTGGYGGYEGGFADVVEFLRRDYADPRRTLWPLHLPDVVTQRYAGIW